MERKYEVLDSAETDACQIELRRYPDGQIVIWRKSLRSGIINKVSQYSKFDKDGAVTFVPIDQVSGNTIVNRLVKGEQFSSAFIFADDGVEIPEDFLSVLKNKSDMEEKFTSTGAKFWKHRSSMESYAEGSGRSVISTHISPEGRCNLSCPYCSVSYRQNKSRLDFEVIEDYLNKLISRGLKALILTGGGEPTLYPSINDVLEFALNKGLNVAMISNGTQLHRVDTSLLKKLTWMRVSVNIFEDWEDRIKIPAGISEHVALGLSFVYTAQHEGNVGDVLATLQKVKGLADRAQARYVRLLPNCLLDQDSLLKEHMALSQILKELDDRRFFHQGKVHEPPMADVCHQSFFRPYLSEEPFGPDGKPGTVFPCDSVVLNQDMEHFNDSFAVCRPEDILKYLDGKLPTKFSPKTHCSGCVFTSTVNMLEQFKSGGMNRFDEFANKEIQHVDFV